ncbi:hypothetical protein OD91_2700 [Lutibacter sp. Hel_I_33_5]|uniref:hypothetical protein n=1 Tax=Lutibacter sp. Hel_I_33_5 TaxID=1566289 RepID=UPI00119CAC25|nr:hypothetical protein [Lutibacter sp. Hel_I_33_5]TVZ57379.1 hypothetical protein OD91_2700 [Lutibacter sp. Hel_I_33_5]
MKINVPKTLLLYFLLAISFLNAQDRVSMSIHQDLKLLALGDNLGNMAGTLNILARAKLQTSQNYIGFCNFMIEYEQANLTKMFSRISGVFGYTINNFGWKNTPSSEYKRFEVTPAISFGKIKRRRKNTFSWAASIEIGYKIYDRIRISAINQYTKRTDLKRKDLRYSFFIGLEYDIAKITSF